MAAFRGVLYDIVEEHAPITVRGVFYRATARSLIPKTETEG